MQTEVRRTGAVPGQAGGCAEVCHRGSRTVGAGGHISAGQTPRWTAGEWHVRTGRGKAAARLGPSRTTLGSERPFCRVDKTRGRRGIRLVFPLRSSFLSSLDLACCHRSCREKENHSSLLQPVYLLTLPISQGRDKKTELKSGSS